MFELGETEIVSGAMPFSAVVGQEELKEALLAVSANEDIDGLLVRGEKGTAKSTTVRALADLLPNQRAVADCPYGCPPGEPERQCADCRERADPPVEQRSVPLVTLPLGATRERVVGSLSVADALDGDYEFEPGLLARANRGVLYVDEVNLLDDHLVDVLLDAAASGVNRVERDSVSVTHPADFTLVGTMNPEEGDLRPQLRDRFALQATVTGCEDLDDRVAIIDRALGRDGEDAGDTDASDAQVRERLVEARDRLDGVTLPDGLAADVAELCRDAGVEGHRGDIATARAARTFAALDGRETVTEDDVRRAAELALPHRLRSRPFEDAPDPEDVVDDHFEDDVDESADGDEPTAEDGESQGEAETEESDDGAESEADGDDGGDSETSTAEDRAGDDSGGSDEETGEDGPTPSPPSDDESGSDGDRDGGPGPLDGQSDGDRSESDGDQGRDSGDERGDGGDSDTQDDATPLVPGQSRSAVADVGDGAAPDVSAPDADGTDARPGSRARADPSPDGNGARVRTQRADDATDVDAAASVRAAATRGETTVESRDLRQSVRASDASTLVVFAVDASASMRPAMETAKGTVLELLKDAYQQRDEVAFVAFAGDDAEVLLPPTDSVTRAARHLKDLPTGDRTPLPAGLDAAGEVLDRADPDAGVVVVVTDGRANAAANPVADTRGAARRLAKRDASVLVVDAGDGSRADLTDMLSEETDGRRVPLDALSAERVEQSVGSATQL